MTRSIKHLLLTLAASIALTHAAHAQTSQSSSWSQSWSSSSGSSWGVGSDGTAYRNGYSNSNSEFNAATTTTTGGLFGSQTNTSAINQRQSQATGFSQSAGPNGFQQNAYNNQSGSLSLLQQQRQSGLFGNATDTRAFNAQYNNQASIAQGIGPNGIYDQRYQGNSGSVSLGRRLQGNSVLGPSYDVGGTRTASFLNEQGLNRGWNSGGLYNNQFNNQNVTIGGSDFGRIFP
jgi:hypothetical protein